MWQKLSRVCHLTTQRSEANVRRLPSGSAAAYHGVWGQGDDVLRVAGAFTRGGMTADGVSMDDALPPSAMMAAPQGGTDARVVLHDLLEALPSAAILLTILPEVARDFAEYRMLIFGLVMVLMMMWRPQGLLPASRPHVELPR